MGVVDGLSTERSERGPDGNADLPGSVVDSDFLLCLESRLNSTADMGSVGSLSSVLSSVYLAVISRGFSITGENMRMKEVEKHDIGQMG